MASDSGFEEFEQRLALSPVVGNRYYLGLLMMAIVGLPAPKVEYLRALTKYE